MKNTHRQRKNKKYVSTRRKQSNKKNKTHYFTKIVGGGNFWGENCSEKPVLTLEMVGEPIFRNQFFNEPYDNNYNLILDKFAGRGNINTVYAARCNKNSDGPKHYAFRRSINPLPENNQKEKTKLLNDSYNELQVLIRLSDLNLAPEVYMAGVYKNLQKEYTFQVMEFIVPLLNAIKIIKDSELSPTEKDTIMGELFQRIYLLYTQVSKNVFGCFFDIKLANLAIRGNILSGDYQALFIDPDLYFMVHDSILKSILETLISREVKKKFFANIKRLFILYLFSSIAYVNLYHMRQLEIYPSVKQSLLQNINPGQTIEVPISEEKLILEKMHTYLYNNNKPYAAIFNAYILGGNIISQEKLEELGILPVIPKDTDSLV